MGGPARCFSFMIICWGEKYKGDKRIDKRGLAWYNNRETVEEAI